MADDEVCLRLPVPDNIVFGPMLTSTYKGASPREIVVEACRRDQPHLLEEVINDMGDKSAAQIAEFFNGVTDVMGNYCLHICALYGSCEFPSLCRHWVHRRVISLENGC